jgi:hypothetical protein
MSGRGDTAEVPYQVERHLASTHRDRTTLVAPARIEPITPPDQVYTSAAFAAIPAAQRVTSFELDYAGQTPVAKGYGTCHVRRA